MDEAADAAKMYSSRDLAGLVEILSASLNIFKCPEIMKFLIVFIAFET